MATTELDRLVVRLEAEMRDLQKDLASATRQISSFEKKTQKSFNNAGSAALSFGRTVASVATVYLGYQTGKALVNATIQMEALENRFLAAAGNADIAAQSMAFVRSEAERLGIVFTESADAFAGFEAAALRSGLTFGETKQIFADIGDAVASLRLSGEKTGLVFRALEQISSKGVVSMEELKLQLGDSLPGALEIAARSMNMTGAEFIKAVSAGEIMSKDFLPKFAAAIKKELGGSVAQASQSAQANLNRLDNAFFDLKTTVAEGEFMQTFTGAVIDLTKTLQDPELQSGLKSFIEGLAKIAELALKVTSAIGRATQSAYDFGQSAREFFTDRAEFIPSSEERRKQVEEIFNQERSRDGLPTGEGFSTTSPERGKLDDGFTLGTGAAASTPAEENPKVQQAIEVRNLLAEIEEEFLNESINRQKEKMRQELAIQRASSQQKALMVAQEFQNIIGTAASGNKTLFQIQKTAAIAQALLSARESVVNSYNFGARIGGPPLGAVMAGVAVAATAAQIQQLASTSFGGGSVTAGGAGGSVPTTASGAVATQEVDTFGRPSGGNVRNINVNISGLSDDSVLNGRQVKTLIEQIGDAISDGAVINLNRRFAV